ncbi:hypothetical protein AB0P15_30710 [Streptomyces sp. NPDC087917]|uniref:hypothetical protein n=1 Tax=Streptomyces sp. NPDC087917 TaxID=3155060 RepID=UPI003440D1B5
MGVDGGDGHAAVDVLVLDRDDVLEPRAFARDVVGGVRGGAALQGQAEGAGQVV